LHSVKIGSDDRMETARRLAASSLTEALVEELPRAEAALLTIAIICDHDEPSLEFKPGDIPIVPHLIRVHIERAITDYARERNLT
jgi:hypothetical protein